MSTRTAPVRPRRGALRSPLAAATQSLPPPICLPADTGTAPSQPAAADPRSLTLAEFGDYLRTINNRDGRPYEDTTINAYVFRAKALDVADHSGTRPRVASGPGGPARSAGRHGSPRDDGSPPETDGGRSATVSGRWRPARSWPLLVLAAPAAVAVWSGWVGIGQMTGFGEIHPLPGIWNSLHVDTAVTLPIGVEAYAAFALHVWLTSNPVVSDRTRGFARRSAIVALVLGMAGQVAYHLLAQAGVIRAPWEATTLVSCLPVLVLGMGSALAHMLRSDTSATDAPVHFPASLVSRKDSNGQHPADQSLRDRPVATDVASVYPGPAFSALRDHHGDGRGPGKLRIGAVIAMPNWP
jgi:hypothetical protein